MGSKPIILAATASIATWSALARMRSLTCQRMARGSGAIASKGAVHYREQAGVYLLLDGQQVN